MGIGGRENGIGRSTIAQWCGREDFNASKGSGGEDEGRYEKTHIEYVHARVVIADVSVE